MVSRIKGYAMGESANHRDLLLLLCPINYISCQKFSFSSRLKQRIAIKKKTVVETRRVISRLSFIYNRRPYYLTVMNDSLLPTIKQGKLSAAQGNLLQYLESRSRELWRRKNNFRAPLSLATEVYREIIGGSDVNYIDLKKIGLPLADVTGFVKLIEVLPEPMIPLFTVQDYKSLIQTSMELELKET